MRQPNRAKNHAKSGRDSKASYRFLAEKTETIESKISLTISLANVNE
jgi:hypothetical protein